MIQISQNEAKILRKKVPGVYIRATMNKLYAESTSAVLEALPNNPDVIETRRELGAKSKVGKFQN